MKQFKYILLAGIITFAIGCQNEDTVMVPIEGYIVEDNEVDLVIDNTDIGEDEPADTIADNKENDSYLDDESNNEDAKIVGIEEVNGESKITFKYKYGDGVFYGVIYDNIYPKYELDIHDRVGIKTIDLDGDGIEEIVIKVNAIGNTLSDRCGTLHIIKLNENGYEEILKQNTNWETPEGGYIIGLIIQNDCLYYESGWKESTENGTTIYTRTYQLIIVDGEIQSIEKNLDIDDAIEW